MTSVRGPRNGFTMAEVLVMLAIVAVLAAVLLPAVARQIDDSEVSRLVGDLVAVRSGIETFVADVHRFPGDLEDLGTHVDASDRDPGGSAYPAGLLTAWRGPYLDRVVADSGILETGFGGTILDSLAIVPYGNGNDYIAVLVTGVARSDYYKAATALDGDTASATGRLRFLVGDTIRFLALPVD